MIRRDTVGEGGSAAWLLIRQIEHARLSAALARQWRFWPEAKFSSIRNHLLDAVHHHDDGWLDWDNDPTLRQTDGAPLSFLEMPIDASLAIMTESIRRATLLGPLAGYVVAGHFLYLRGKSAAAAGERVRQWSARTETERDFLLSQWQNESPELHTPAVASEALQWLQIWDALSLWFCCVEPHSKYEATLPDQTLITFRPAGGGRVDVIPWVFHERELQVGVQAIQCPAERHSSAAALMADRGQTLKLRWLLTSI